MRELSVEEIRNRQVATLDAFVSMCEKNGLCYYLCGGTLLGAIRHKGFIPWDDDIDVFMPRPDFEKIQNLQAPEGYDLETFRNGKHNLPFLKIVDTLTLASEEHHVKDSAIWVDIFAIDGLFANDMMNKLHYKVVKFLRRRAHFGNRQKNGIFGKCFFALLKALHVPPCKVNTAICYVVDFLSKIKDYRKSPYIGGINWGYGPRERMRREDLEPVTKVEFEGKLYNAPVGYDIYLHNLYGDYMQLPPEDKRKSHGLKAWLKD